MAERGAAEERAWAEARGYSTASIQQTVYPSLTRPPMLISVLLIVLAISCFVTDAPRLGGVVLVVACVRIAYRHWVI